MILDYMIKKWIMYNNKTKLYIYINNSIFYKLGLYKILNENLYIWIILLELDKLLTRNMICIACITYQW